MDPQGSLHTAQWDFMVHDNILAHLLVTFLGRDEVGVHSVEIAQKKS